MNQYPGYPYPAYPGYPPPPPVDYYAYATPNPYGYTQPPAGGSSYTSASRHTRLPSEGNAVYPAVPPHRENGRRGHHARRHTAQGISKEQRILGYEPNSSDPPIDVSSKIRRDLAPDFLFVSLSSNDILKLSGPRETIAYLSEMLQVSWPGSIPSEDGGEHQIRLGRDAWSASGEVGMKARKLVCELFVTLAQEGFQYSTTINNHPLRAPRLVFTSAQRENQPRYFMICFSLNRRTAHIINAPEELTHKIAKTLRVVMPFRPNEGATVPSRTDGWIDSDVYEVTTSIEGGRVDFASLMAGSLKFIATEGWRFEASVPFARSGLLGVRGRREAWMFRLDSIPSSEYKSRPVPNPMPNLNVNVNVASVNSKQQQQQQQQQQQRPGNGVGAGGANVTVTTVPRAAAASLNDERERERQRLRQRERHRERERERENQRRARGGGDF